MNWDSLPVELIKIILSFRKNLTCDKYSAIKIQSLWRTYKIRVLVGRFKMLRYLKDFRVWNPNLNEFITRSKL